MTPADPEPIPTAGHADPRLVAAELAAFRDLYAAAPPDVAAELGAAWMDIGPAGARALAKLPGDRVFNQVLGLALDGPARDADLDAVAEFARAHGARPVVSLSPGPWSEDLGDRLAARGYEPSHPWTTFRRSVEPLEVATDLRIEPVGPERGPAMGRVVATAFELPEPFARWMAALPGRPGWHCFLALDGVTAAGAGGLHVHEGIGWLGFGSTLLEHRGRGAQGAIFAARIAAAARDGCTTLITETGAPRDGRPGPSYRNILRVGFEPAHVRPNLIAPAS